MLFAALLLVANSLKMKIKSSSKQNIPGSIGTTKISAGNTPTISSSYGDTIRMHQQARKRLEEFYGTGSSFLQKTSQTDFGSGTGAASTGDSPSRSSQGGVSSTIRNYKRLNELVNGGGN